MYVCRMLYSVLYWIYNYLVYAIYNTTCIFNTILPLMYVVNRNVNYKIINTYSLLTNVKITHSTFITSPVLVALRLTLMTLIFNRVISSAGILRLCA